MSTTAPSTTKTKPAAAEKSAKTTDKPGGAIPQVAPSNKAFEKFSELAASLAAADADAQIAGNQSKQAQAARASLATDALKAAIASKASSGVIRDTLTNAGVLKGTASKIVTVATAVALGEIASGEFKTLYEGYTKVSLANRVANVAKRNAALAAAGKPLLPVPGSKAGEAVTPVVKIVEKVVMPAPKDALQVILDDIIAAGGDGPAKDEDMILDRASFWVKELTDKITALTRKINDGDDD